MTKPKKVRINLPELATWKELSHNDRFWAGVCARQLQDSGLIDEWRPGCAHQVHFSSLLNDMTRPYALSSILCALTHDDVLIAFRAYAQAVEYTTKGKFHDLSDAMRAARARVETLIKEAGHNDQETL